MRLHGDGCRERIRQAMVDDMGQQRLQEASEAPGTKRSTEEQEIEERSIRRCA